MASISSRRGHVCAFTYNYVKTRPEYPAPHDLLSSGGNEVCFATTPPDMEASCIKKQQSGYATRYTFSAKEKDDETQYSYFGARYYDSDLSVWLSVDPMSDEYPHQAPYMYCSGSPVMRIDINGMWDGWVEGNGTGIYWDPEVNSPKEATAKGLIYHGQEGTEIDETTGSLIYYNSDGTKSISSQNLPPFTVMYNENYDETYKFPKDNPSLMSNNRTGLIWDYRDLAIFWTIGMQDDVCGRYIQQCVHNGKFEFLSAERYWNYWGDQMGNFLIFREFFTMMSLLSGPSIVPKSFNIRGYNYTQIYYNTPSKLSFQNWLSLNSFRYRGQFVGQDKGAFFKQAWADYKSGKY